MDFLLAAADLTFAAFRTLLMLAAFAAGALAITLGFAFGAAGAWRSQGPRWRRVAASAFAAAAALPWAACLWALASLLALHLGQWPRGAGEALAFVSATADHLRVLMAGILLCMALVGLARLVAGDGRRGSAPDPAPEDLPVPARPALTVVRGGRGGVGVDAAGGHGGGTGPERERAYPRRRGA